MTTNAIDSQGSALKIGDGAAPEAFTEIPGLSSISGPSGSRNVQDTSDLASTAREKRGGLKDEGQVQCSGFFIPSDTQHQAIETAYDDGTTDNYELEFSDGSKVAFAGLVTELNVASSLEVDQPQSFSFTIEVTGSLTRTAV